MAGEGIAAQQMLQQQAALEQRNAGMQNMMKQQAASQIMRQIAMGEVQREMARESQTGRALGSAADRESRRDVGKARMETQKELEEKQRLLGLIGGAAEAAGALGAHMISQQALEDAQFQGRMEAAALDPEVDDMSQFNPEDLAALQAMSQEQTLADAAPLIFDEEALSGDIKDIEPILEMERLQETAIADANRPVRLDGYSGYDFDPDRELSIDDSFPRDAGMYELDTIRGMIDPRRGPGITGMPLTPEEQLAKEVKDRRVREQLRAIRRFEHGVGSEPINPYAE